MKRFLFPPLLVFGHVAMAQEEIVWPQLFSRQKAHGIDAKLVKINHDDRALLQPMLAPGAKLRVRFEKFKGFSTNEKGEISPNFSILVHSIASQDDTLLWLPELYANRLEYLPENISSLTPGITIHSVPSGKEKMMVTVRLFDERDPARYNVVRFPLTFQKASSPAQIQKRTSNESYTYQGSEGVRAFASFSFDYPKFTTGHTEKETIFTLEVAVNDTAALPFLKRRENLQVLSLLGGKEKALPQSQVKYQVQENYFIVRMALDKSFPKPDNLLLRYYDATSGKHLSVVIDVPAT